MKSKLLLAGFFLFYIIQAQQVRPSVKWYELNTEHFRIIYPRKIRPQALEIAAYLESAYQQTGQGLKTKPKRTPVILNNRNAVPNAYARLAPRKMEWFLSPDPDLYFGTGSWKQLLALHEFRHITQFDAANTGFIRLSHLISGQAGHMINLFWTYPMWFFEGDAVYNETALSLSGRGRSPYFYLPVITTINEYKPRKLDYYSYYFRSYKTYYPSHYHLGYFLTAYLHKNFPEKYAKIYRDAAWTAFIPGSMQLSLQLQTKLSYRKLTRAAFADLKKNHWKTNRKTAGKQTYVLPGKPQTYTMDLFPQIIADSTLAFLRYGFDHSPGIWLYDFKHKPYKIKSLPAYRFHASRNLAVWTEYKTHPRWHNEVYKRLVVFDFNTRKTRYLKARGNFQNPALSPGAKRIATVDYDEHQEPYLRLFDVETGRLIKSYHFSFFESIRQPAWHPGEDKILFTAVSPDKGSGLYEIDLSSGKVKTLIPPKHNQFIQYPAYVKDKILYEKGERDIQIVLFDPETGKEYFLTGETYAAAMPSFDPATNKIYFSAYGPEGYQIKSVPLKTFKHKPHNATGIPDYYNPKDMKPVAAADTAQIQYSVKKFNRLKSYFTLHSWFWLIGTDENVKPVATANIFMSDLLDESFFATGASFFSNEYRYYAYWEWKRYFPVFGFRYDFAYYDLNKTRYNDFNVYMRLPLDWSSGVWNRYFSWQTGITLRQNQNMSQWLTSNDIRFTVSRQRAYRDPESRLALSLNVNLSKGIHSPGRFWHTGLRVNMPGLFKHDLFQAKMAAGGTQNMTQYFIPLRGFPSITSRQLTYGQFTWHTPLFYPDAGLKRLFNLKRVRLKLFYDRLWNSGPWFPQYSFGFQLIGDWNLFGFLPAVPIGIQVAKVQGLKQPVINLVLLDIVVF